MSVRQKIQRNKAKSQSFEYSPLHWLFDLKKKIKIFFWMWTVKKKSILNLLQYYFCFMVFCFFVFFWLFGHKTCGILAPQPGVEPVLLH